MLGTTVCTLAAAPVCLSFSYFIHYAGGGVQVPESVTIAVPVEERRTVLYKSAVAFIAAYYHMRILIFWVKAMNNLSSGRPPR